METSTLPSSHLPAPAPILIIDQDSPILHQALKDDFPEMHFDLCTSLDQAERNVLTKHYQALVANVRLTAMQDFSFLKWHQSECPTTPFIVSLAAYQQPLASQALAHGALDFILKPVIRTQAVQTVRGALWLHQFRVTIGHRKQTLEAFKGQHATLALKAPDLAEQIELVDRGIKQVERTIESCQRSIAAVEESLTRLTKSANDFEDEARHRAVERLGAR